MNKAAVLHELPASWCQLVHKVIVQERVSATGEPALCYQLVHKVIVEERVSATGEPTFR